MKNIQNYTTFINEKMWVSDVKPKKNSMKKALGIPEDEQIKDHYTSGKKLAEDLVSKLGKKKAASMINFAANANKEDNIFDVAQKHLKNL